MLTGACRYNAVSPVPTSAVVATCRSIFQQGLMQYVLNTFSKKCPPYHVTQDDVILLYIDSKWR